MKKILEIYSDSLGRGTIKALSSGTANLIAETDNGLKAECTIYCYDFVTDDTPIEYNNWTNPAYYITETCTLNNTSFSIHNYTSEQTSLTVDYSLSLTKTYCRYSGSYSFKLNYKVYAPNGDVVKSGTITTPTFAVGETTTATGIIYFANNHIVGTYRIEFSEVAW